MPESKTSIVRIAAIRARHDDEFHFEGLDPHGVGISGEIKPPNPEMVFAIATSMFATGRSVYYSYDLDAISTDATFGNTPSTEPDFREKLYVINIDGVWMLGPPSGKLVMTLSDGTIVTKDVKESNVFIGWLNMLDVGDVRFDGETLFTER
jgi:hypothetical protein